MSNLCFFLIIQGHKTCITDASPTLKQFKGNNSCITEAKPTKLKMHQCVMVIHIYYKFHRISLKDYLIMAEFVHLKLIQRLFCCCCIVVLRPR